MAIEPVTLKQCLQDDLTDQGIYVSDDMEPWPDITLKQAAGLSIYTSLLKKLSVGRTNQTDLLAAEKFLACNRACGEWELDTSSLDVKTESILGTVRQSLDDFWHRGGFALVDNDYDVLFKGALGPGISIGSVGNDFYTKLFSSPLTVSDRKLYESYKRYIWNVPEWSIAETIRSLDYGDAIIAPSSRLSFVPKNDEISRCICIEPTLNVFYQLGLGRILERRLYERYGISLTSQPFKNRMLARLGSITDGLATLDLSSASDSISLKMLRYLLPRSFYAMLVRYRSRQVEVKGRGTVDLEMVSTMGNGYTFPLQTIIFSAVVTACMAWRGIPIRSSESSEQWSVFGDDIICPGSTTSDVVGVLTLLGFKVNRDKSFVKGPFRESCGYDFFNGVNIRGVYVKTLNTPEARYSVINLLTRFSTRTGIDLGRTLTLLLNSVQDRRVPVWEDYSSGIHTPSDLAPEIYDIDTQSRVYYARVASPRKIRVKGGRVVVPRGCKPRIYNPPGLLVSLLQGSVKSGTIGVREDTVKYKTERRISPSWDWYDSSGYESNDYDLDWGRFHTVLKSLLKS